MFELNPFARGRNRRSHDAKAVVTGAGSGIGRAFALELARRGGNVICSDINLERAEETVDMIRAAAVGRGVAHQCDVADQAQMVALKDYAADYFGGPVSLIINNAGVGLGGKLVGEIGFDDWEWAIGINLRGVVHGSELFTPQLREAKAGGVINVASAAGFAAAPSMAPYNATKAAVISLSETMAAELSGTGVAVTVLCPTFVATNVIRDGRVAEGSQRKLAETAMRLGRHSADDVARQTLDANDKGNLYVVPQLDANLVWQLKRHFPGQYTAGIGLINRFAPK